MTTNNKESCLFMESMNNIKPLLNLSSPKSKADSLNEMEQISGQFVIYKPVLW